MALNGTLNTNDYDGRFYQVRWTATQSINNNSSTINWTVSALGGGTRWFAERTLKVVIAGKAVVDKTDRVERYDGEIASGSFTLAHAADGTKMLPVSIQAAVYTSTINCVGNTTFELNQIPKQATITGAPAFTDEDSPTITYINPAGNSVTSLDAAISWTGSPDIAYRSVSKTGNSYTFNFTTAEKEKLQDAVNEGKNSKLVTFYLRTVINGTTYYSTIQKTLSIANALPVASPTVTEKNTKVSSLTGGNAVILGYSNVECNAHAVAKKRAWIASARITNGSNVDNKTITTFNNIDSNRFIFEATDSRGNRVVEIVTKNVVNYVPLTVHASLNEFKTDGTASFNVSGNYFNGSFGAASNYLLVTYQIATVSATSYGAWQSVTETKSGNSYTANFTISGLDYTKAYKIIVRAQDELGTVQTAEIRFSGRPIFEWGKNDFKFNVPVTFAAGATGADIPTGGGSTSGGTDLSNGGTINGDLTVTGNLRLKGSGNYGNKLYFGDGSYAMVSEDTDDALTIKANTINLNGTVKVNGSDIGTGGGSTTGGTDLSSGGTVNGDLRIAGLNQLYLGDDNRVYAQRNYDNFYITGEKIQLYGNVEMNGYDATTETGTWTPTIGTGSEIDSYTTQQGWYQKVGNIVTVGFYIKAICDTGFYNRSIYIGYLPYAPKYSAAGGGMCSGTYVSAGFNFQCFVAEANSLSIKTRVQSCNNTSAANLDTSASGVFYRYNGGEITLSGTICYTV